MDSPCIKQTVCKVLKIFQHGKYLVAYMYALNGQHYDVFITNNDCYRSYHWGLLDDLMYEIPGKDNYPGVIYDSAFGLPAYQIKPQSPLKKLNTARYHRYIPRMPFDFLCRPLVLLKWPFYHMTSSLGVI